MDFINNINEETLVIGNNYLYEKIKKINRLIPIKFMTLKDLIKDLTYTYDEEAIIYLINKYNLNYDIAKIYMDNIIYVKDKLYKEEKINKLSLIKKELIDNNLLKQNNHIIKYLKRTHIILYDIHIDSYLKELLKEYNYEVIDREYQSYKHKIYEFDTMEEEVNYVAKEIASLIYQGIDINNIKLTNIDETYYNTIERVFSYYNLKVNINRKAKLISYQEVKDFIKAFDGTNQESIIDKLNIDNKVSEKLIKVINKYLKYNNPNLLKYKIENAYITNDTYTKGIDIVDYETYISNDNEYIFMLGMNDGLIPKYQKDVDYLSDHEKEVLGLTTSKELNKQKRERVISCINDIKNLTMTYKKTDTKREYYPASINTNYEIVKVPRDLSITYSPLSDKIDLIKKYDNYYKFGIYDDDFSLLLNNYPLKYNNYSNKYTKIKRIPKYLKLSYSKMQNYNKCAFKYYLTNILKVDIYEENFSTVIGSMVHFILENSLKNNDYDIDKYANIYLKDRLLTKKETFFLEKYKESIKDILKEINLEKEYSLFNQAMYEKEIDIDLGNNVHFTGIIDKVLYYITDDITYVSLIDYKTGNDEISLKYLKYGLDIQLPIYLYLSTKLNLKNIVYCGFYLQKFNINEKDYRLVGYSNSNKDILKIQDKNYEDSKIIKGLKVKQDGSFYKTSKVISNEEIDNIKKEVEKIIKNVTKKINDNDFTINPKIINGKNISCEYCKYKDICFASENDEIVIDEGVGEDDELN